MLSTMHPSGLELSPNPSLAMFFSGVCLPTGGGGGVCGAGGMHGRGACMAGEGMHGGGMHGRGRAWQIPRDTVNEQAVRILLECILVANRCTEHCASLMTSNFIHRLAHHGRYSM